MKDKRTVRSDTKHIVGLKLKKEQQKGRRE